MSVNTQADPAPARGARTRRPSMAGWAAAPVLPSPVECLTLARAGIVKAQQLLILPTAESLLAAELCMRGVADRLKQFKRALAATPGKIDSARIDAAVREVREEFEHADTMFRRAAQFHAGWTQMFSVRRCGYTRHGAPAKLACVNGTSVHA